jgi:ribosomal protein S18 acetylase RimI-like enzyme
VELQGSKIGTFSLQWNDEKSWGEQPPNSGYLHGLAISDDYRGKGLGAHIINIAKDIATTEDKDFLRLDCSVNDEPLCAYYESLGFYRVGINANSGYNGYIAALYEIQLSGASS